MQKLGAGAVISHHCPSGHVMMGLAVETVVEPKHKPNVVGLKQAKRLSSLHTPQAGGSGQSGMKPFTPTVSQTAATLPQNNPGAQVKVGEFTSTASDFKANEMKLFLRVYLVQTYQDDSLSLQILNVFVVKHATPDAAPHTLQVCASQFSNNWPATIA